MPPWPFFILEKSLSGSSRKLCKTFTMLPSARLPFLLLDFFSKPQQRFDEMKRLSNVRL